MPKDIKETIRDFVKFDIENDYYKEDEKKDLVKMFEEILFEDDTTVRQFLKSVFSSVKDLANDFSLVADEGEAIEEPSLEEPEDAIEEPEDSIEEPEDAMEEPEDAGEEPEDALEAPVEHSNIYTKIAANILYE